MAMYSAALDIRSKHCYCFFVVLWLFESCLYLHVVHIERREGIAELGLCT